MRTNTNFGHAPPPPENALLDERQAAARLGISARTLYGIRSRGEIAWVKIGYLVKYRVEDLDAYILAQRQAPTLATA